MNLQGLLVWARGCWPHWRRQQRRATLETTDGSNAIGRILSPGFLSLSAVILLLATTAGVYRVNHRFAMHPYPRRAYAYEYEMPAINFRYNRRLYSMDEQGEPESPFMAQGRYVILAADQPPAGG